MPKKTTDDDNVRELPIGEVDFDLDAVEKDAVDDVPVFKTTIGGRVIEMTSPVDVDWRDLAFMSSEAEIFQYVMSDDDVRYFNDQAIPGWKLNKLVEAYDKHYGLRDRVKRAEREQRAAEGRRGPR